jgi:hypothetical protein
MWALTGSQHARRLLATYLYFTRKYWRWNGNWWLVMKWCALSASTVCWVEQEEIGGSDGVKRLAKMFQEGVQNEREKNLLQEGGLLATRPSFWDRVALRAPCDRGICVKLALRRCGRVAVNSRCSTDDQELRLRDSDEYSNPLGWITSSKGHFRRHPWKLLLARNEYYDRSSVNRAIDIYRYPST